jgi:hypothetical protein
VPLTRHVGEWRSELTSRAWSESCGGARRARVPGSRAQQLRHHVNLFLCSSANDLENRLLPNDLIVIRNQGVDHGGHVGHQEGAGEPRKHAQ